MSSWPIKCTNCECGKVTQPVNIAALMDSGNGCRDDRGLLLCEWCGSHGYIEKSLAIQEGGAPWNPYLKGIIQPNGYAGNTYQPFVFLVGYSPEDQLNEL